MSSGTSMIFFCDPTVDLARTEAVLRESGLTVKPDPQSGQLRVSWGGPELMVHLSREAWVIDEANEIAEGTSHADAMGRCDARFEIFIHDLDEVLDEINTLIEVQATLQQATRGFLFNDWNCRLSAHED